MSFTVPSMVHGFSEKILNVCANDWSNEFNYIQRVQNGKLQWITCVRRSNIGKSIEFFLCRKSSFTCANYSTLSDDGFPRLVSEAPAETDFPLVLHTDKIPEIYVIKLYRIKWKLLKSIKNKKLNPLPGTIGNCDQGSNRNETKEFFVPWFIHDYSVHKRSLVVILILIW